MSKLSVEHIMALTSEELCDYKEGEILDFRNTLMKNRYGYYSVLHHIGLLDQEMTKYNHELKNYRETGQVLVTSNETVNGYDLYDNHQFVIPDYFEFKDLIPLFRNENPFFTLETFEQFEKEVNGKIS